MRCTALMALTAVLVQVATAVPPPKSREEVKVRIPVRAEGASELLRMKDFSATVNGAKARVIGAKTPKDDQMILIVLDLSEDLAEAEVAKQALISTIHALPKRTYVSLLRAQDGPIVLVDPTLDRKAVARAIEENPVNGRAALLDTLDLVESLADSVSSASGVRVAVLYVTDSDVRNYREDLTNPVVNSSDPHDLSRRFPEALVEEKMDKMGSAMAARHTPLFIVHLKYLRSKINSAYQTGLKTLADELGGSSWFCSSISEIPAAVDATMSAIGSEYLLTVSTAERLPSAFPVRVQADGAFLVHRAKLPRP